VNRRERRAASRQGRAPAAGTAPIALISDGVRHHEAGRLAEAARFYEQALKLDGQNPDALHLLGLIHHQTGGSARAVELIRRAIAINPDIALYHNNMGAALRAQGRDAEAVEHYRRAVALDGADGAARVNLGNALDALGRRDDAAVCYREALRRDGDNVDAHIGLAGLLVKAGDLGAARIHCERAAALDPASPIVHRNLAGLLFAEGRPADAIASYRKAVALDPGYAEAWINLGALLRDSGPAEEAEAALHKGLSLRPDDAYGLESLGLALEDQGRIDEAVAVLRQSTVARPDRISAIINLGNALRRLGRFDEAIACFGRVLEIDPGNDSAAANRALGLLAQGRFGEGWDDFRRRNSVAHLHDRLEQHTLPGDLAGKRIYVVRDQGLGDEIFFLRFVRDLERRGPRIAYRAQAQVAAMIGRLPFIDRPIEEGRDAEITDAEISVSAGDLPWLLGVFDVGDLPPTVTLEPLADRVAEQRALLEAAGPPPWIGVTWRAGLQQRNRLSKIAPQDALAEAMRGAHGTLIALQRNPEPGEIERFTRIAGRPLHDFTALNSDLEAMLALLGLLDDYVCVSNTNVHLRAARGRPSRVLVPYPADYRWMDAGDESPWFPGSPVYRETPQDGWQAAFDRLAADLARAWPPSRRADR
jgi:tetratricopeptide (TPR) repeat protein